MNDYLKPEDLPQDPDSWEAWISQYTETGTVPGTELQPRGLPTVKGTLQQERKERNGWGPWPWIALGLAALGTLGVGALGAGYYFLRPKKKRRRRRR